MKKSNFDPDAAFKNIVKPETGQKTSGIKGRPPVARETKKVKTLALYQSVYENIQKIAYVERRSMSDIIGELMEAYIKENQDKLKEYDDIQRQ